MLHVIIFGKSSMGRASSRVAPSASALVRTVAAATLLVAPSAAAGGDALPGPGLGGLAFASLPGPGLLAAGDVDGDGDDDLLSAQFWGTSNVQLLLARGDGSYESPTPVADFGATSPANFVRALELDDLDGDGSLDLLVVPQGVLPGDGLGGFGELLPLGSFGALDSVSQVLAGDLDGDGALDFLVLGELPQLPVAVHAVAMLGQGDGHFAAQPGGSGLGVAAAHDGWILADMDGDGTLDLVGRNAGMLALAKGVGNGSFAEPLPFAGGPAATSTGLVAGDFDADGRVDVALTQTQPQRVEVWLGDGAGGLSAAGATTIPGPLFIAPVLERGDFDGDGDGDVVVSSLAFFGLLMFAGDGAGQLATVDEYLPGLLARTIRRAEIDGDGRDDLLVGDFYGGTIRVLHGAADAFVDVGIALGGAQLHGSGSTVAEQAATLRINGAPPGAAGFLFVSLQQSLAPFHGGVLVPMPDLAVPAAVGVALTARWPTGLPDGAQLLAQAWLAVPAGGVVGTNALAMIAR